MRLKTITRIFLPLLLLTILTPFLFAANNDHLLIGQEAPIITGKKAVGKGLLSLTKLMSDLGYKKDKNGKFVEKKREVCFRNGEKRGCIKFLFHNLYSLYARDSDL